MDLKNLVKNFVSGNVDEKSFVSDAERSECEEYPLGYSIIYNIIYNIKCIRDYADNGREQVKSFDRVLTVL